ncbi:HAMP domain-containing protein [Aerophototrophica crusticola]|uniref:HAMP domain-containing protein n=1 Tax=Aerophototrophica crusticola TaxID=1709002 RepID=A0A858R8Y2_9PROT|nr:HAMP domain-containing protein [Rhodospirillaceae bacterium B3]
MMADTPAGEPPLDCTPFRRPWRRKRFRLPIAAVLVVGFGGLVLLAVASVLVLGLNVSGRNTSELVGDKADLVMKMMETRVRTQLEPARAQAEFVTGLFSTGQVDPAEQGRLADTLRASLAAAPQITGIGFLAREGDFHVAVRDGKGGVLYRVEPKQPWGQEVLDAALQTGGAVWADPIWAEEEKATILSVRVPVRRDGRFLGIIVTGVSFLDLSRFLDRMDQGTEARSFILYDDTYVLAHPALPAKALDYAKVTGRPPLPTLAELGDPVAAGIWQKAGPDGASSQKGPEGMRVRAEFQISGDPGLELRASELGDKKYVYLLKTLKDYGSHPWTLAIAFDEEEVTPELRRLVKLAGAGFVILVVSVLLALLLGKAISRQIKRLAGAAVSLRDLDFQTVPELPDSRFREVSDAAEAFNTMVSGLRWFETYVPKALVLRLIRREARSVGVRSEEREVTVLFTDIKSFSALAEAMSPQETADWLNRHFTRIAACIEEEGGTVDKFIGDAVMAFWGAPEDQPDHAARALRAAMAIARVVEEEGAEARAAGRPAICLRVGVHSGPVVVGNIGALSRINYTIVGDTVNTAARLEALGSELLGDECCVALVSADTVRDAGDCVVDIPMQDIGTYTLRGRTGPVRVWRLKTDPAGNKLN